MYGTCSSRRSRLAACTVAGVAAAALCTVALTAAPDSAASTPTTWSGTRPPGLARDHRVWHATTGPGTRPPGLAP
jgi:hypothetical protein